MHDNPLNSIDPTGLCGWNPFGSDSCVGDAASAVGNAVASGAQWVGDHPGETIGIVAGVAAAATGVGAVIELGAGATTLGIGLGIGSVVSGGVAAGLDARPCLQQGDTAACVGLGFGAVGTALGGAATGGSVLAAAGIIGETSTANGVLAGLGAFGLNVGIAGTVVDAVNLFAASGDACHR